MAAALTALQAEGFVMRGRFTPNAVEEEWCERRLLARINRYTVKRLRAEIEPVSTRDFLRFLLAWQHVDTDARLQGPHALAGDHRAAGRLRGAGRRLGEGDPCRLGTATTNRAGSTTNAGLGA